MRRLRARCFEDPDVVAVDIRKAYLQLFLKEEQQVYQGFVLRDDPDGQHFYRMTRVSLGLSVPKALEMALEAIFNREKLTNQIDYYVDDLFCGRSSVAVLKEALSRYGFETKEPERVVDARVLGV